RHAALLATLRAEKIEEQKESEEWKKAATTAAAAQRTLAMTEAKLKLCQAQGAQSEARTKAEEAAKATNVVASAGPASPDTVKKAEKTAKDLEAAKAKAAEAEKALAEAERQQQSAPTTAYKPRATESYPSHSSGRRLAFAQWLASRENPLTARVAVNQIWLRH